MGLEFSGNSGLISECQHLVAKIWGTEGQGWDSGTLMLAGLLEELVETLGEVIGEVEECQDSMEA